MKVLTIIGYDDAPLGQVTAVVGCPDDCDEATADKLFCEWLRFNQPSQSEFSDEVLVSGAEYAWNVCEVHWLISNPFTKPKKP